MRLWNTATECPRTLEGHTGTVYSVALSADGSRVVSGSWDNTVRLWNTATGECLRTLEAHRSVLGGAERGRVSGGVRIWDNTVRLWNTATGECLRTLEGTPRGELGGAERTGLRWCPDLGQDGTPVEHRDRRVSPDPGGHTRVISVALSADGSRVVSDLGQHGAPVEHRDRRCLRTLEGTPGQYSVALSADGSRVVSGSVEDGAPVEHRDRRVSPDPGGW